VVTSVNSALVQPETIDHLEGNANRANQTNSILQFILSTLTTTTEISINYCMYHSNEFRVGLGSHQGDVNRVQNFDSNI
jgi:hypothetical protein